MFTKLEEDLLRQLLTQSIDLNKRRVKNAAPSLDQADYVTQRQLTDVGIDVGLKRKKTIILIDEAYGSGWNGSVYPPTKNAVYNEIQTVLGLIPTLAGETWSPGVSFGGGVTGITYANQIGLALRTTLASGGSWLTLTGGFTLSSKGSSMGAALITGLPTKVLNLSNYYVTGSIYAKSLTGATLGDLQCLGTFNTTTLALSSVIAGVTTALDDTYFTNTSEIRLEITYRVT